MPCLSTKKDELQQFLQLNLSFFIWKARNVVLKSKKRSGDERYWASYQTAIASSFSSTEVTELTILKT